jgi:putative flavoprotein involved in K+ transport
MLDNVPSQLKADHDVAATVHVRQWLSRLEKALADGDCEGLGSLFLDDSHWRDLLAFTWNITPTDGGDAIVALLAARQPHVQARAFEIAEDRTPPRRVKRTGEEVFEAIFRFQTATGRCLGVVRLPIAQPDKAWVLSTSVRELQGYEEPINDRRADGAGLRIFGGETWASRRAREQVYDDRQPAVLIVGAGQCGLSLGARLRMLGVDALIVEKLPKVGDVWRNRYDALALHNGIELNSMPYMPYPSSWPRYLPKDMLGNWLEAYALATECNVWTGASFVKSSYDEANGVWDARVRRADGSERLLHPRHLVFANGIVGAPKFPHAPGLEDFKGEVVHTEGFRDGAPWRGKNVLVLGAGNSAHDAAQDLHGHGAHVKMIQRGSVTVFSVKAASLNHAIYYNEGLPVEDCDLIATSVTFPLQRRGYQLNTQRMLEMDKELLERLAARGFKLDIGEDGAGHQMKVRRRHGGYYLNVGCSELIANGQIGLLHYEDIERFVPNGALMKDGHIEPAELLVTGTGYQDQQEVVRELLGEKIARKVGPVWGLDEGGELANMFKPTPQKGLWFAGGGFAQARVYSHYIALQIKAREVGLVPD